jgi:SAM-dependent methyltransferase
MKKILELGAGKRPYLGKNNEDVIHTDIMKLPHIEVVHDLNKFPWPLKKNEFDEVLARHVLEHLDNIIKVMDEIGRILKPNGIIKIWVPYFSHVGAVWDLTHKHFFTLNTFDYWDKSTREGSVLNYEIGRTRFKIIKKELHFSRVYKFINIFARKFPHIYEVYFSRVFPAYEIYFELKIIK